MAKKEKALGAMSGAIKKPTFGGGKRSTKTLPPDKKVLEAYGGARPKGKPMEARVPGNREFGFIQSTPKQATGAMMGRGLPPLKESGTRSDSRKQFKAKGKKVF